MLRSDWKELSKAFGQNRRKDKQELIKYRADWERLKGLLPAPGKIMKPSEIKNLLEALWEIIN